MKKHMWYGGMIVAAMVAMAALPALAAGDKVAIVRLEQLLKAHPDTAPAEALLDKQRDEFEAERRDMLDERDTRKKAFEAARDEAENAALSEEARVEKIKGAQTAYKSVLEYEREIQDVQLQRQKELNDHGRRLRERIVESIRGVIKSYAEKEGYTVVINAENAGQGAFGTVLYNTEQADITEALKPLVAASKQKDE